MLGSSILPVFVFAILLGLLAVVVCSSATAFVVLGVHLEDASLVE